MIKVDDRLFTFDIKKICSFINDITGKEQKENEILDSYDFGDEGEKKLNAREKGGGWNPEGNALLVDQTRNHKDWRKYVELLVKNPEYVKQLQDNLYRDVHEKYDLRNVTKDRAEFYKQIVKK